MPPHAPVISATFMLLAPFAPLGPPDRISPGQVARGRRRSARRGCCCLEDELVAQSHKLGVVSRSCQRRPRPCLVGDEHVHVREQLVTNGAAPDEAGGGGGGGRARAPPA